MKLLLSPAKKMRCETDVLVAKTQPLFLNKTAQLLSHLQILSLAELQALLACNISLARLNYERFQTMDLFHAPTPAILAFDGIQYQYMAPQLFSDSAFSYIEDHVRILSGFYGVLRPLDGVVPYRLEMQARLRTPFCKNLYDFWGNELYHSLAREDCYLINLSSQEYARAIVPFLSSPTQMITCFFYEDVHGKLVEKGVYVKMARGEMVRFLAENSLCRPQDLKDFTGLGFTYVSELSTQTQYVFTRSPASVARERHMDF